MSRCEHGEHITLFCLNENCNWRQAGGCEQCFKKYHAHSTFKDTLTVEKLQQLNRLFYVRPELKTKSRILQQAVYNYFIIMKSQLSTSIDAVSRTITNRLNHPYLVSEGQLSIFKKIKSKEYKKITEKQLKIYYNFVNSQNKDLVELNEKKLYQEEVQNVWQAINNINDVFVRYSKAVQRLDNSFNIEKSFFNKIVEIAQSISQSEGKDLEQKSSTKQSNDSQRSNLQNYFANTQKQGETKEGDEVKKNNTRDRKVSLDYGLGTNMGLNKYKNTQQKQKSADFDGNQKQIYERKKKLFDMVNNLQPTSIQNTMEIPKKANQNEDKISKSLQKNMLTSVDNTAKGQIPKHSHVHVHEQRELPSAIPEHEDEHRLSSKFSYKEQENQDRQQTNAENVVETDERTNKLDKQTADLFQNLLNKGINLPQMILHTILPRQEAKLKLYEDTSDVKSRKITIPVKKFEEAEENSSPLLKRKRQKNRESIQNKLQAQQQEGVNNKMGKISLFANGEDYINQQPIQEQQFQTPKKKQDETMMLKDREADSVALLIQSLPLPAEKAIPLLEAAMKYSHNNLSAAQYLSYLYLQIEKPKQCLELCNKILEQLEDSPQANELSIHINNNKAASLNLLGRYSESIGILERCLNFAKRDIYYKNLGDSYFCIGIYEKAIFNYEQAIRMNNQLEQAFYNLGVCYYMQEHMHEARLNVNKALKLNPKSEEYLRLSREIMIKLES